MKLKQYRRPVAAGWLGWLEDRAGEPVGFVSRDGTVVGWDGKQVQADVGLYAIER